MKESSICGLRQTLSGIKDRRDVLYRELDRLYESEEAQQKRVKIVNVINKITRLNILEGALKMELEIKGE